MYIKNTQIILLRLLYQTGPNLQKIPCFYLLIFWVKLVHDIYFSPILVKHVHYIYSCGIIGKPGLLYFIFMC